MKNKIYVYILLILIIVLGFSLRMDRLGDRSFWFDEIVELQHTDKVFAEGNLISGDGTGGRLVTRGYYLFLALLKLYTGNIDEFIARLPAVFFGVLTIPLLYMAGRALFTVKEGIISSFLLSISTYHIAYSQEARPYSMLALFSLLSFYSLYMALKYKSFLWWVVVFLSTILNIYSHYAAFYVLGAEIIYALLWLVINHRTNKDHLKHKILILLLFILTLSILIAPVAIKGIRYIIGKKLLTKHIDGLSFNADFFYRIFGDFVCLSNPFNYRKIMLVMFTVLLMWGLIRQFKYYKLEILGLLTLIIAPFFMVFTFFKPCSFFNPRYFIFILPILLMSVALGLTAISKDVNRLFRVSSNTVLAILLFLVGALHIYPLIAHHYSEKDNWRAVGEFLNKSIKRKSALLISSVPDIAPLDYYLSDQAKRRLVIRENIKDLPKKSEIIWCVTYADYSFSEQKGYEEFRKNTRILDLKRFGDVIKLYKSKYIDKLSPGDIGPIRFEAEDAPSFVGRKVRDGQAENKYAKCATIFREGKINNLLVYGPFFELPKGDYIVKFRLKISDNRIGRPVVRLDINNTEKEGGIITERNIAGVEFEKPKQYGDFYLPFSHDGNGKLEFRAHYLGETDLWVDYAEVMDKANTVENI